MTIVVCCDRLPTSMIGAYGGEWVETPTLDALAGRGVVFQRASVDRIHSDPAGVAVQLVGRLKSLSSAGVEYELVSNRTIPTEVFSSLDDVALVDESVAGDSTSLEMLFAAALEVTRSSPMSVLWLDISMLDGGWLPPLDWQGRHFEEEEEETGEPEPGTEAPVAREPGIRLPAVYNYKPGKVGVDYDTAEIECIRMGWADRLAYLDALLGVFLGGVREKIGDEFTVFFTADSGEPLGENGFMGPHPGDLSASRTAIPLIVSSPNSKRGVFRFDFVSPSDLWYYLLAGEDRDESPLGQSLVGRPATSRWYHAGDAGENRGAQSLETSIWKLVRSPAGVRLFAKPEDFWDVNDLSERRLEDCQRMLEALEALKVRTESPSAGQ